MPKLEKSLPIVESRSETPGRPTGSPSPSPTSVQPEKSSAASLARGKWAFSSGAGVGPAASRRAAYRQQPSPEGVEGRVEDRELLGTGCEHGPERPMDFSAVAQIHHLEGPDGVPTLGRRDGEPARAEQPAEADGAGQ